MKINFIILFLLPVDTHHPFGGSEEMVRDKKKSLCILRCFTFQWSIVSKGVFCKCSSAWQEAGMGWMEKADEDFT